MFLFPPLRERWRLAPYSCCILPSVSIHTSAWEVTSAERSGLLMCCIGFQFTPLRERWLKGQLRFPLRGSFPFPPLRERWLKSNKIPWLLFNVSIHTSAWEVTQPLAWCSNICVVSIPTSAREVTHIGAWTLRWSTFLFTPLRERWLTQSWYPWSGIWSFHSHLCVRGDSKNT